MDWIYIQIREQTKGSDVTRSNMFRDESVNKKRKKNILMYFYSFDFVF